MSEIEKIKSEYLDKLNSCTNSDKLNQIKTELFGKNGIVTNQFKIIGSKSEDRKSTRLNSSHSQQSRMPSSA